MIFSDFPIFQYLINIFWISYILVENNWINPNQGHLKGLGGTIALITLYILQWQELLIPAVLLGFRWFLTSLIRLPFFLVIWKSNNHEPLQYGKTEDAFHSPCDYFEVMSWNVYQPSQILSARTSMSATKKQNKENIQRLGLVVPAAPIWTST